ncbi:MAG: hypothetical protein ACXW3C_03685 [Pyrinomonadaceae bacterium]
MKREFFSLVIIAVFLILISPQTNAQDNGSVKDRKFEVGGDISTVTFGSGITELGVGGRFTYNLNSHVALEAAGYYFPNNCNFCGRNSGRVSEGLFGVKIGKRFNKWGIFGKVRPGVLSFSKGQFDIVSLTSSTVPLSFVTVEKRLNTFAIDVGGVLEFYPTKRIITRMDFGVTGNHYGSRTTNFPVLDPVTGTYSLRPFTTPAQNLGTLQLTFGIGYRF